MDKARLVLKGLRFGMLLQLAVGPVCLLVLKTAANSGFVPTLSLILAVTFADALFIALSTLGATAVLGKPSVRGKAKALGGAVLVLFGLDMVLGALGVTLIPGVRLFSAGSGASLFVQGLLITLSNPLTILFWSGALTAKVLENRWRGFQLFLFALGCVLATLLFLTFVAAMGGLLITRLPETVLIGLNIAVGLLLMFFGLRLLLRKAP